MALVVDNLQASAERGIGLGKPLLTNHGEPNVERHHHDETLDNMDQA